MGIEEVTWGTWEELLLGGAVLRHGTRDWDTVAAELRSRALSPYTFTPQVCRAKYDDLQQRYSKCTTWFEEVRKKRMAELRQALEVSEDSIGSLETKLETLKAEKASESRVNYASSQTESPVASHKSEGFESKDGLSAGSFTVDHQIPDSVPAKEAKETPEVSPIAENAARVGTLKKRRGVRKRKDCSVGESGGIDLVNTRAGDCAEVSGSSGMEDRVRRGGSKEDGIDELLKILDIIEENECASRFYQRLDSQKRGRYKKMIRKHVDFETLRSRIASRTIVSAKEVFRDIMLVVNNALVFYSKNTREYKSARLLRDHATKNLHRYFQPRNISAGASSPVNSDRAGHGKRKSPAINDVSEETLKKEVARAKRPGPKSNVRRESESPIKGRKRVRAR